MEVNNFNRFVLSSKDLLNEIFYYASASDLTQRICLVCKKWKEVADSDIPWKQKAIRLYGQQDAEIAFLNTQKVSWKAAYILGPTVIVKEWKSDAGYFIGQKVDSVGTIYEGEFKASQLNGQGKMTTRNRTVYEGEFKADQLNGQGKIDYSDGPLHEGQFKNNKLNGQGQISTPNGKVLKGEFKANQLNGQGKIIYQGTVYEGEFKANQLNGQGKITFLSGSIYEGEFKDNQLNGQGKITYSNGKIYEGQFKNGKLNGQGKKNILIKHFMKGNLKIIS